MPKVAIIGAGSTVFAQQMIRDILAIEGLPGGEFALVDIDTERLELSHEMAEITVQASGKPWTLSTTTERRDILPGCDFVISTIEVAGLANVRHDYDIPLKYGVDQCIGDTIGPGGIFKYLRTAPAWIDICYDIEDLCPDATVLNYTNPMSALVLAAVRATDLAVVGLCHSVQGTSKQIAGYLGVPYNELRYECGGINHLAWFTRLEQNGEDLYPRLHEAAADPQIYEADPVRFEMMKHFGAFVTESSGHFSEYVPYFRTRPALIEQYTRAGYLGESGFYANNWPDWRAGHDAQVREKIAQYKQGQTDVIDLARSHEYGSYIVEGRALNRPQVIYGNVYNTGLIDNLPQDGCVEVACLVDRNGVQPTHFGTLPTQLAALDAAHMMVHDLMADAVLLNDREAAVHALLLDPLTAAVCSPAEARQMFDEMAAAQARDLPEWVVNG